MFDCIRDLLSDPTIAASCVWRYAECSNDSCERIFSEPWTGDWWKSEQSLVGSRNILAIIMYCDETSTSFAGKTLYPVYLSLANLPVHIRNSIAGKKLVGFLPEVSVVSSFTGTEPVRVYCREVSSSQISCYVET